jgi:ribosomal protein S18 acetylase RimI-like enzyme
MEQAMLDVDVENPNAALDLYRAAGFRVVYSSAVYRKPFR